MTIARLTLFLVSAVSSYAALVYKLGQARRSWRDAAYANLIVTLTLQCMTFTMGVLAMGSDSLLGIKNFAILLMHLSAVAFCVSAQILLLQWSYGFAEIKRRIVGWALAGVFLECVLVVLFFVSGAPDKPREALSTGCRNPLILAYLLIFMVSQAAPCMPIYFHCKTFARLTTDVWLRRALRLIAISAVLFFLYCLARVVNVITPLFNVNIGGWVILASVFSGVGIVMMSIGLTMPSWGVHASKLAKWGRNYASYRDLHPLWDALRRCFPDIVLEPPSSQVSDLHYRLHRRVIEIRDGWRALRPYMAQSDSSTPIGLRHAMVSEEDAQACAEALLIDRAIRARKAGAAIGKDEELPGHAQHDADTFAAEVAWLRKVSASYGRLS